MHHLTYWDVLQEDWQLAGRLLKVLICLDSQEFITITKFCSSVRLGVSTVLFLWIQVVWVLLSSRIIDSWSFQCVVLHLFNVLWQHRTWPKHCTSRTEVSYKYYDFSTLEEKAVHSLKTPGIDNPATQKDPEDGQSPEEERSTLIQSIPSHCSS